MITRLNSILIIISVLIVLPSLGQVKQEKADPASELVMEYLKLSLFNQGIHPGTLDAWEDLFDSSAMIVFDIPFRNTSLRNDDIKRISKDDRQQSEMISVYGKILPIAMYKEILAWESGKFGLEKLDHTIILTGKKDLRKSDRDTIVYEVEKRFKDSTWSVQSTEKYLVYIHTRKNKARIVSIKVNAGSNPQTDVVLKLVNSSSLRKGDSGPELAGIEAVLSIRFEEPINNYSVSGVTNADGIVRFDRAADLTSEVSLDTIRSPANIRYEIPQDWEKGGKKVSDQPTGGFIVGLKPYEWNGFSYSVYLSGGLAIPGTPDLENFQDGSSFDSKSSSRFGAGFNFTYFFNYTHWKVHPEKWMFGLGSGIFSDYGRSKRTSSGFVQDTYGYEDLESDSCQVMFSGKGFTETEELINIGIPLYLELKKWMGNKFSFSARAGANMTIPVSGKYEAKGSFSRWGFYEDLNTLPVTEDPLYNYYTDRPKTYNGYAKPGNVMAEGFLKLSGFFNVFKHQPDNSIEVGLVFMLPLSLTATYIYPESEGFDYTGYWMQTGNTEYHSMVYSTKKAYNYFFGVTIGMNLVNYKPR